jgi:hypothetical protein
LFGLVQQCAFAKPIVRCAATKELLQDLEQDSLQKSLQLTTALCAIFFAVMAQAPVFAAEPLIPEVLRTDSAILGPNQQRLVAIDRDIMLELIKLGRFNIKFHLEANRRWPWRSWLYPLAQEAGTSASFANTLTDLVQRAKGLDNLDRISSAARKRGLRSAIVGNAISGSASAAELLQNAMVVQIASRQGFSPRDSVAFVKKELATIDTLLAQRQQIVTVARTGPIHQAYELEGRLLQQSRDQLLLEFKRWSVNSREVMWRQNAFYGLDSMRNFTLLGSSVTSTRAFNTPSLRGAAAITGLVGNTMAALNPTTRTLVGMCMRKYQRWHLSHIFPDKRPGPTKELLAEWGDLEHPNVLSDPDPVAALHIKEVAFLVDNAEKGEGILSSEQRRIEKLRQIAIQQSISGPIIGMASVARSVLAVIGYYEYRSEPEVSNKLGFAGRISQACGQTYSLINTPTTLAQQIIYTRRLKKRGELPAQVLERRLNSLNQLEKEIEAAKSN